MFDVSSQQTEKRRTKKKPRKATLEDFVKVQSKLPEQKSQAEVGRKKFKKKMEIDFSRMEEKEKRPKKVFANVAKTEKIRMNKEFQGLLNFNIFSVLETEEFIQESINQISSKSLNIPGKPLKKKKKTKANKSFRKYNIGSVDMESSEGKYPEVNRCIKCFVNHFPSANSCKFYAKKPLSEKTKLKLNSYFSNLNIDNSAKKIIRLRGGAGNGDNESPLLVTQAIESAKKHGINLVIGVLNEADGNCAFDAVINNVNHRSCFNEKLSLSSEVYRQIWVTELEDESSKYPTLGAGYTKEEKEENWNHLKQSGVYEVDFFGDLVLHAIARGCNKNILIFNTNVAAADPIYVVEASQFGGFSDSDIPVVVAYNQVHYESLHPVSELDIDKTKMLVNLYIAGNYQYKKKDIPFLISASSGEKSNRECPNVKIKNEYDIMFPPLVTRTSKVLAEKECSKQLLVDKKQKTDKRNVHLKEKCLEVEIESNQIRDQIIKITENVSKKKTSSRRKMLEPSEKKKSENPKKRKILNVREMSDEERKKYWSSFKAAGRLEKRQQDDIEFKKIATAEKSNERSKKRQQDEVQFKKIATAEKSNERSKKRQQDEVEFKKIATAEKSNERSKKRQQDEVGFKNIRTAKQSNARSKKRQENESELKQKRCEEQKKTRFNRIITEDKRAKVFKDSIKDGRIYECVSCHRLCFKNGVNPYTDSYDLKIENKYPGLINSSIGIKETIKILGNFQICISCRCHISKGKVPPMSNQNNLQLMDLSKYEELQLTELENAMIALNIIFQKVFKLPKSRWPAMKDRTVNIPIFESDIIKTIESLPRTPSEAGIIPIKLKRKLNYKNSHMVQYISVPKILKALDTLKEMGNRYYQFIPKKSNFEDACRENDLEGFHFIYPKDEIAREEMNLNEESIIGLQESDSCDFDKENEQYEKLDAIKKWQFDYNK